MAAEMNPVNWFEIPTTDLERATSFYETALGISLSPMEMAPLKMAWFPMTQGAAGATGALVQGEGYAPSASGTLVFIHVDDIDATLARIAANGGKTLVPKTDIGEYGSFAHFEDTEGNRVALHSD